MRSQHGGKGLPHVAAGEHRSDGRTTEGEKTQHPPTQTHTSLLLRHHSRASTKLSASPSPSPASPLSSPILSCLSPPSPSLSLAMSQKALSTICCRMLQITSVYVHVFSREEEKKKRAQKVIFMHLLCPHTHTHGFKILTCVRVKPVKIVSPTLPGTNDAGVDVYY